MKYISANLWRMLACGFLMGLSLMTGCSEVPQQVTSSPTPAQPTAVTQATASATPSPRPTRPPASPMARPPTATSTRVISPSPAPTLSPTPVPPTASSTPSATPTEASALIPPPTFFEVAWADRSIFRSGLIDSEQAVLDGLPGASVYHLDLQLAADFTTLQGRQEVRYTNQEAQPLPELYFRLFPNLLGGRTTVSEVKVNGAVVEPEYEFQASAMRLALPQPLLPDQSLVIQIGFTVEMPTEARGNYGAFGLEQGVLALAHIYPMLAVYDQAGWNVEIAPPIGDIIYADTSFYLVRVTTPATRTVVTSGVEVGRELLDTTQVITFAAGPVRDFYLAASDHYSVTQRTIGQTTINSYAPAELMAGAELALNQAEAALQHFNERFGAYPYTEFDLVGTTTFARGLEYPTIVAILLDLYDPASGNPAGLLEGVVAHEVAHQWFYGVVGNDQVDEPWLDEALAQYLTLLYYTDVYGPQGAAGFRGSLERRWSRGSQTDMPIGLPVSAYDENSYSAIVYGRGPLFVEHLAETMGQETFDAFLRDYYQSHKWGIVTTDDFKQLAEQHCDCDLTPVFEAWVDEK